MRATRWDRSDHIRSNRNHLGHLRRRTQLAVSILGWIFTLCLLGCGGVGQLGNDQSGKQLTLILITPQGASVPLGKGQQFSATGISSDGSRVDITEQAVWSSAQPGVATVSASGMAVSKATGTTQVTATSGSVKASGTLTVTASALDSIAVTPNVSLTPGHSAQLTATGSFTDGSQPDLTASVTWRSASAAVVKVSGQGLATAKAVGRAAITATSGFISGTATVSVVAATLVSISISPSGASIPLGRTQQLTATANFDDGSTQNVTSSATWGSSPSEIIDVSSSGAASAKAMGTATVSATSGGVTGSDLLTVGPPALATVEIIPTTSAITLGTTVRFTALGTLGDGTTQDLTSTVSWTSADPNIASISDGGLARALQIGSTTIFASSDSISGSAALSVLPVLAVTYFANANTPETLDLDATVRIGNPGSTGGNLCAMVYVFDADQQLTECCGCLETPSGLRTLSVNTDLTRNPLTGVKAKTGVVKIVPADAAGNPSCNPTSITPAGEVVAWSTNLQQPLENAFLMTETQFQLAPLGAAELSALQNQCAFVNTLGSGQGICTCGTGD